MHKTLYNIHREGQVPPPLAQACGYPCLQHQFTYLQYLA